ncbi:hypothetical protein EBZ35_06755, partial [bacterium]|nr:hypothetical protein [bacterium]
MVVTRSLSVAGDTQLRGVVVPGELAARQVVADRVVASDAAITRLTGTMATINALDVTEELRVWGVASFNAMVVTRSLSVAGDTQLRGVVVPGALEARQVVADRVVASDAAITRLTGTMATANALGVTDELRVMGVASLNAMVVTRALEVFGDTQLRGVVVPGALAARQVAVDRLVVQADAAITRLMGTMATANALGVTDELRVMGVASLNAMVVTRSLEVFGDTQLRGVVVPGALEARKVAADRVVATDAAITRLTGTMVTVNNGITDTVRVRQMATVNRLAVQAGLQVPDAVLDNGRIGSVTTDRVVGAFFSVDQAKARGWQAPTGEWGQSSVNQLAGESVSARAVVVIDRVDTDRIGLPWFSGSVNTANTVVVPGGLNASGVASIHHLDVSSALFQTMNSLSGIINRTNVGSVVGIQYLEAPQLSATELDVNQADLTRAEVSQLGVQGTTSANQLTVAQSAQIDTVETDRLWVRDNMTAMDVVVSKGVSGEGDTQLHGVTVMTIASINRVVASASLVVEALASVNQLTLRQASVSVMMGDDAIMGMVTTNQLVGRSDGTVFINGLWTQSPVSWNTMAVSDQLIAHQDLNSEQLMARDAGIQTVTVLDGLSIHQQGTVPQLEAAAINSMGEANIASLQTSGSAMVPQLHTTQLNVWGVASVNRMTIQVVSINQLSIDHLELQGGMAADSVLVPGSLSSHTIGQIKDITHVTDGRIRYVTAPQFNVATQWDVTSGMAAEQATMGSLMGNGIATINQLAVSTQLTALSLGNVTQLVSQLARANQLSVTTLNGKGMITVGDGVVTRSMVGAGTATVNQLVVAGVATVNQVVVPNGFDTNAKVTMRQLWVTQVSTANQLSVTTLNGQGMMTIGELVVTQSMRVDGVATINQLVGDGVVTINRVVVTNNAVLEMDVTLSTMRVSGTGTANQLSVTTLNGQG